MNELRLLRKLKKEQTRVRILEDMIEYKSRELFHAHEEMKNARDFLSEVCRLMPGALILFDTSGLILQANETTRQLLGFEAGELVGEQCSRVFGVVPFEGDVMFCCREEQTWSTKDGEKIPVLSSVSTFSDESGRVDLYICVAQDLRKQKALEVELRHAQKMESVGQLAAGVAHEINTPIQFVGDSVYFLEEAYQDLRSLMDVHAELQKAAADYPALQPLLDKIKDVEEDIDLDFLSEETPTACTNALRGIERVSKIVAAMKRFVHPDCDRKVLHNVNEGIQTVLTVAHHEYKYVAEADTDLGDIPDVMCFRDDLHQVLLNLIVNATHAIEDNKTEPGKMGRITIRTRLKADYLVISVQDTGTGIPEEVQQRIFDPFFTTKEVGRGTGQGLALAHSIIVDKHKGRLTFETAQGQGTTFFLWIPLQENALQGREMRP